MRFQAHATMTSHSGGKNANITHSNKVDTSIEGRVINLVLRDDGAFAKGTIDLDTVDESTTVIAQKLTPESIIRAWAAPMDSLDGGFAIAVQVWKLTSLADAVTDLPAPIISHLAPGDVDKPAPDASLLILNERLNNRIIDVRVAATGAVIKLFSGAYELAVEHLVGQGFHWIHTPALINYRNPGDDDYFSVNYIDGQEAWLTQTGEYHLFMALSAGLERVFDISTVFRREKEVTTRHLTEFTALEVVFNLQHNWEEVLEHAESLFTHIIHGLQEREKYKGLLKLAKRLNSSAGEIRLGTDVDGHLPRVRFSEAKALLRNKLGFPDTQDQDDLTKEEEKALGQHLANSESEFGPPTDLFLLTHFPKHLRTYNVKTTEEDPSITYGFDAILGGQEACTGFQAIHDHRELRAAMQARNPPLDPDDDMWRPWMGSYEAGAPPQGGFGIGLNRLLQGFLGLSYIHETTLWPRDPTRLAP
ncbi:aspartate-trna ligase [Fusarium beomiforme]|uniref:aspartate--tRNA ligase n=1 Tax=Fusarium beomiforme TaxID=44412 RepID=A0A9P5DYE3_9HYPO|nr:aspartate-trna ligase [Fusarium beomiforme]